MEDGTEGYRQAGRMTPLVSELHMTNKCNFVVVAVAEVSGQTSRKNRVLIWEKGLQKAEVCRAWFYGSFRTLRGIFFVIRAGARQAGRRESQL